jgi:hypothetical protein
MPPEVMARIFEPLHHVQLERMPRPHVTYLLKPYDGDALLDTIRKVTTA